MEHNIDYDFICFSVECPYFHCHLNDLALLQVGLSVIPGISGRVNS